MKWLKNVGGYLFAGINIATILMMWACCWVTYLDPATFPRLSLLTLIFPIIVIINLLFIPFWLIFKFKRIWLPLLGFVVCGSFIWDYCPMNFSDDVAKDESYLKLLSYNTRGFGGKEALDSLGNNAVANLIYSSDADIICLQESHSGGSNFNKVRKNMDSLGYHNYNHKGVVVFSRLPIIEADTLSFPTRTNSGICLKLLDGNDTIMLINNHFESNHLTDVLKNDYRQALEKHARSAYNSENRDTLRRELSPVVNLLSVAAPLRAAQADSIAKVIDRWLPRPVIVMGDFNDTPVSYPLCKLTRRLTSAYSQSGTGLGFTFHERGFPVRIDHILFSGDRWKSHHTYVDKSLDYSDHYPIFTKLTRK
ncbi:MAG: endonuclease/exonuclease/phosphatase family protein [Bacteroidaceae bacterium]|nr:endonuclease/exonuclease/phosphatase family protein [Bacteroidaceae bacterium]